MCSRGCCAARTASCTHANITDVDDKINAAAKAEGVDDRRGHRALSRRLSRGHDRARRGCRRTSSRASPSTCRRSCASSSGWSTRGHAYVAEGHVLFSVPSYPGYGKLSGRATRGHDRRRARGRRAVQARSGRLRALEAVAAGHRRLVEPVGPRPPGLAHRVLGDGRRSISARRSTSTAAAWTSCSRITRTRPRRARCAHGGRPYARYWLHNGMVDFGTGENVEVASATSC